MKTTNTTPNRRNARLELLLNIFSYMRRRSLDRQINWTERPENVATRPLVLNLPTDSNIRRITIDFCDSKPAVVRVERNFPIKPWKASGPQEQPNPNMDLRDTF